MKKSARAASLLILVTIGGCASYPVNAPLDRFDSEAGYRFKKLVPNPEMNPDENPDERFVILTFSGGGTRAAALAYGVLEQLSRTKIDGGKRTLLDEVDVISSVSGGSFTAAYYALFRDKLFESFEEDFLKKDVQGAIALRLFSPWNLIRLASPWFSRIDLAAEYYGQHIFDKKTYCDLVSVGRRPFLILNAADMTFGTPFEFTQEQFDLLYSDLNSVPIGRAVAASSAFPVLFSPVTFKNHPREDDFVEPQWIDLAVEDREFAWRRYRRALHARSFADRNDRPNVHLLDGGVVENLGVPAIMRALTTTDSEWSILRRIGLGTVKRVIVIVVNAKPEADTSWDRQSTAPKVLDVLSATINGLQGHNTFESAAMLWDHIDQARKDQGAYEQCQKLLKERMCNDTTMPGVHFPKVQYHAIEVSFGRIREEEMAHYFKSLPTTFTLPDRDVECLQKIGPFLLGESVEFQELVKELDGDSPHVVQERDLRRCR